MIKIKRVALEFILNASKNTYPKEFIGLLRMNKRNEISEVLVIPQSIYGEGFSSVNFTMVPSTSEYSGSIHSHPTPNARPSRNDLVFFSRIGGVHIIVSYPFSSEDVHVYGWEGNELGFEVV